MEYYAFTLYVLRYSKCSPCIWRISATSKCIKQGLSPSCVLWEQTHSIGKDNVKSRKKIKEGQVNETLSDRPAKPGMSHNRKILRRFLSSSLSRDLRSFGIVWFYHSRLQCSRCPQGSSYLVSHKDEDNQSSQMFLLSSTYCGDFFRFTKVRKGVKL